MDTSKPKKTKSGTKPPGGFPPSVERPNHPSDESTVKVHKKKKKTKDGLKIFETSEEPKILLERKHGPTSTRDPNPIKSPEKFILKKPKKGAGKKKREKKKIDLLLEDDPKIVLPTYYIRKQLQTFTLWRLYLTWIGRFPTTFRIEYADGVRCFENFKCRFYHNSKSVNAIVFFVINVLVSIVCVVQWMTFLACLLDSPGHGSPRTSKKEERKLRVLELMVLYRYWMPCIRTLLTPTFMMISGWVLYGQKDGLAQLFNYHQVLTEELRVDVKPYMTSEMFASVGIYLLVTYGLAVISTLSYYQYVSIQPSLTAVLLVRMFHPNIFNDENFPVYRAMCFPIFMYIFLTQHAIIILYLYHVRLVEICASVYNARLDQILNADTDNPKVKLYRKQMPRDAYERLYTQYLAMLDFVSGVNHVYEPIIISFFFITGFIVTIESYYVVKSQIYKEDFFDGSRTLDNQIIWFLIIQQASLLIAVILNSANVVQDNLLHTQVYAGRRGMKDTQGTPAELKFALNICAHYQGHFDVSIGSRTWFGISRHTLILVFTILQTYFTVFCQFNPEINYPNVEGDMLTTPLERDRIWRRFEGVGIRNLIFDYPNDTGRIRHPIIQPEES